MMTSVVPRCSLTPAPESEVQAAALQIPVQTNVLASHRQSLATIVCILLLSSQSVSLNVASILSAYWIIV